MPIDDSDVFPTNDQGMWLQIAAYNYFSPAVWQNTPSAAFDVGRGGKPCQVCNQQSTTRTENPDDLVKRRLDTFDVQKAKVADNHVESAGFEWHLLGMTKHKPCATQF